MRSGVRGNTVCSVKFVESQGIETTCSCCASCLVVVDVLETLAIIFCALRASVFIMMLIMLFCSTPTVSHRLTVNYGAIIPKLFVHTSRYLFSNKITIYVHIFIKYVSILKTFGYTFTALP